MTNFHKYLHHIPERIHGFTSKFNKVKEYIHDFIRKMRILTDNSTDVKAKGPYLIIHFGCFTWSIWYLNPDGSTPFQQVASEIIKPGYDPNALNHLINIVRSARGQLRLHLGTQDWFGVLVVFDADGLVWFPDGKRNNLGTADFTTLHQFGTQFFDVAGITFGRASLGPNVGLAHSVFGFADIKVIRSLLIACEIPISNLLALIPTEMLILFKTEILPDNESYGAI